MRQKRPSTLAEIIRWQRERHGYSLREVAEITGLTNPAISQIETGHTKEPSFRSIVKLARALNLSIKALAEIIS